MLNYRYSRWDGSQEVFQLDADQLLNELADELLAYGDVWSALRRLWQRGLSGRLMGLQDLLRQLRSRRQELLDKYKLDSVLDDIRHRLDDVVKTEREGIERRLSEARKRYEEEKAGQAGDLTPEAQEELLKVLENLAARSLQFLDNLPQELGGAIKELASYEFMDSEAKRKFDELMEMLKQRAGEAYMRDLSKQLENITPEQLAELKDMIRQLNQMLRQRLQGAQPDFARFMQQFGGYFGPEASSLDELMEKLRREIAQMESLLDSLPEEVRESLRQLLDSALDDELKQELAELAAALDMLSPRDDLRGQYPFRGEEPLSFSEALRLMEQLQNMDQLEQQLARAERGGETVDGRLLKELLGEEAYRSWEQLKQASTLLEEAGYIRKSGNRYELTPLAMRKLGQKALGDIFSELKKSRLGKHQIDFKGVAGDRADDTKKYEFGDPFFIHLEKTLMNALRRQPPRLPIKLDAEDLEVYSTEHLTRASTALLLDMSLSMPMRGNFVAAKKVALALESLIRTQFPRDTLHIIGFADYAHVLTTESLQQVTWNDWVYGTNMQHALETSRKLLSRDKGHNRQIIMVTDGEPTVHMEGGRAYFSYPPSAQTIHQTLLEVKRCTAEGITINIFMIDESYYLVDFVNRLVKINKGRAFFTTPDKLGQYVLVDYINHKRKRIRP